MPKFARLLGLAVISLSLLFVFVEPGAAQYKRRDLVSNTKGKAMKTDPNLVNGWGMAFFPHGPFWVANDGSGTSTLYGPNGTILSLVVTVPPAPGSPPGTLGLPTGMVANPTTDFVVSQNGKSGPAAFLFATVDGTISGWNPNVNPTNAVIAVNDSLDNPAPFYTGLAIGVSSSGQNFIYAADQLNNKVEIYDGGFNFVKSFTDPSLPAGFNAFNIQNIQGKLFVTFAGFLDANAAGGFIDVFDTDGNFVKRFASLGELDLPWGMTVAPGDFGEFSNDLLVGNLGNGQIIAYGLDGQFKGWLKDDDGQYISIDNLWGIAFGTDPAANGPKNRLFFVGGPVFYQQGVLGFIEVDSSARDSDRE